jgi:hypothetical protein
MRVFPAYYPGITCGSYSYSINIVQLTPSRSVAATPMANGKVRNRYPVKPAVVRTGRRGIVYDAWMRI